MQSIIYTFKISLSFKRKEFNLTNRKNTIDALVTGNIFSVFLSINAGILSFFRGWNTIPSFYLLLIFLLTFSKPDYPFFLNIPRPLKSSSEYSGTAPDFDATYVPRILATDTAFETPYPERYV